jgi:hypothetical protein
LVFATQVKRENLSIRTVFVLNFNERRLVNARVLGAPFSGCRSSSDALQWTVRGKRICSGQLRKTDRLAFGGGSYFNDRAEPMRVPLVFGPIYYGYI